MLISCVFFISNLSYLFLFVGTSHANTIEECRSNANDISTWTNTEIDLFLICRGVTNHEFNVNGLPLNYNLVRSHQILVYGTSSNAPGNTYHSGAGQYRYFGQTISGSIYPNIDYPPDATATTNVATRNYLYQPWNMNPANIYNSYKPEVTSWMAFYTREQKAAWLDRIVDKYTYYVTGDMFIRGNWIPNWTGDVLVDYAVIHEPPTDYGPGYVTLWHRGGSQDWYDTHMLAPLSCLFPGCELPTTVPDGQYCTQGSQTSMTRVSGFYSAPPCDEDGYCTSYPYFETLGISLIGATPQTVKAGQGVELYAITTYTNQNPAHIGSPYAPSSMRFTGPYTDDWPNTETRTVNLIPNVANPATFWGGGRTVVWKLPYALIQENGTWTMTNNAVEAHNYVNASPYNFGGLQRWYFGFDIPDGENFNMSIQGSGGHNTMQICDERSVTINGTPYEDFVIRTVDPYNPFPTGDVGLNWQGNESIITDLQYWYTEPQMRFSQKTRDITDNSQSFFERIRENFMQGFRKFRGD